MKGLLWLVRKQLAHHRVRSALLAACLGLVLFIPLRGTWLVQRYDHDLRARAATTPLVLGQPGNRFDLCLGTLFFRQARLRPMPWSAASEWTDRRDMVAVPMHLGHHVQGAPLVGVTPEYFERRGLQLAAGQWPLRPGEIVLGATFAQELQARVGGIVRSDPAFGFGLDGPASQELRITGILKRAFAPDDRAALGSLSTTWLLDGHLHGHDSAQDLRAQQPDLVLAESGDQVLLSGAVVPDQEAQRDLKRLHLHGSNEALPISAILIWPDDEMVRTIAQTEVNAEGTWHMLRPAQVIDDLMAQTLRLKTLIDRLVWVLGLGMACLFAVISLQSAQLRAAELITLRRMGAPPGYAARLIGLEVLAVALSAGGLAAAAAWCASRALPNLVHVL